MTDHTYEPPSLTPIGSLHDLTLQNKDFTGSDGIVLTVPGLPPTGLGNVT